MRSAICLLLLTSLTLLFAPASTTMPLRDDCPTVVVTCPDRVEEDGKNLIFRAEVKGVSPVASLTYHWTISAGTISSGQDSSSISVDTTGIRLEPVTATVQVGGLPKGCPNKASCTTGIARVTGCARPFDQIGEISFKDEAARLDNFAIQLQLELSARGFIIAYGGRTSFEGQASERARRAKDYLTERHNFVDDRIVTIDGGYREEPTVELWIVPQEASEPTASPTLRREDVVILNRPVKGGAYGKRNR